MKRLISAALAAASVMWAGAANAASVIDFEDYDFGAIYNSGFGPNVGGSLPFVHLSGTIVLNPLTGVGKVLKLSTGFTGHHYYSFITYSRTRLPGTNIVYTPFVYSFDAYAPDGGAYRRTVGYETEIEPGVWTTIDQNEGVRGWGQQRRIVATSAYIDNIVFDERFAVVPEPGTWAMMITGFGLAGTALRRRSRPQAA